MTRDQKSWQNPGSTGEDRQITILVVDENEHIRSTVSNILRLEDYRVLEAACGEEGLRLARETSGRIELLITDLQMPDMGGGRLLELLELYRPETRVLVISAIDRAAVLEQGLLSEGAPFLSKPFSLDHLLDWVRALAG